MVSDIKKYLNAKYEQSPEKSSDILAVDYIDVLKVIYFVAKADGQYRKEEKEVIAQYVRTLIRDERITTKIIDDILIEIDVPTMQGFKLALGRVLKGGEINPELFDVGIKGFQVRTLYWYSLYLSSKSCNYIV